MTIQIQKILLPTDFSQHSATAVRYACELAAKFAAELHLLHTLACLSRTRHPVATPDFGMGLACPGMSTSPRRKRNNNWPACWSRSGRQAGS